MFRHWYRAGDIFPIRRCGAKRPPAPRRRPGVRLGLEVLEVRCVPSVSSSIMNSVLTIVSDDFGNTINLDHNAQTGVTTVNGTPYDDSQFLSIQINGGHGSDTDNLLAIPEKQTLVNNVADAIVNVGKAGSVQGILGSLQIENPPHFNTLTVDDSADTQLRTVTMDTFISQGGGDPFGRIRGLAPASIFYEYADTSSITVKTGRAVDTVDVLTTGVTTAIVGAATETVNVGNNGLVSGIGGLLTVFNPPAFTVLNVNNMADTAHHNVTMGVSSGVGFINGLAPQPIQYIQSDVSAVVVNGGPNAGLDGGLNHYTVTTTATNSFGPLTAINVGNAQAATVDVQATLGPLTVTSPQRLWSCTVGLAGSVQGIRGAVTFINNTVANDVSLDDSADGIGRNVTVNDTSITGLAPAAINYQGHTGIILNAGLAANTFTVNGNSGSTGTVMAFNLGSGATAVNVRGIAAPLQLYAGSGPVTTTVGSLAPSLGGTVANIRSEVDTHNYGSTSSLVVDDSGDATSQTATVGLTGHINGLGPGSIGFPSTQSVTIYAGTGGNTFTVTGTTPPGLLTLNTGTGADTVNVQSTTGPLTINGQNGLDSVNLGETSDGTASIKGTVTVTNANGRTALTVNDQANPFATTNVALNVAGFTGTVSGLGSPSSPFTLQYVTVDANRLTVNGSGHGNTYNVRAASPDVPVTLHTGSGNDTVNVGNTANSLDDIHGTLTVDGQADNDTLNIFDRGTTAPHGYTLTSTMFVRSPGGPTITYLDFEHLNSDFPIISGTGPVNNVIDVQSTAADTSVEINAGGGATVNVGNEAGNLDDLQGPVHVVGDDGSLLLNVNDQGSAGGQDYAIADTTVDRTGAATISYAGVRDLTLNAGAGGNQIDVEGLPFGTPAVVNAGMGGEQGFDLIRMRGGPVNAPLTLRGQGNTHLGYVAYTTPVLVDVPSGQATDVKGGFSGINTITGGQDVNILVGDGNEDLNGVAGSRNLLISGGGSDTLTGGGVGDILVGAATAYDADAHSELEAILAEWTSGSYQDVVPHVIAGDTALDPYPLNATTVFDNGAQNSLIGHPQGGELNLYYVTDAESGLYDATADETVINVSGGPLTAGESARPTAPFAENPTPEATPNASLRSPTAVELGNAPQVPLGGRTLPPTALTADLAWSDAWQPSPPW